MMHIGPFQLRNRLVLAPMAGVTDRPFRQLCKQLARGWTVPRWSRPIRCCGQRKTPPPAPITNGEVEPRTMQMAGAPIRRDGRGRRHNVDHGAQIIDINMGCPAKKVCNVMAGSALLQYEDLVQRILEAVVEAVDVPVTLKIRTGWDRGHRKTACAINRPHRRAGRAAFRCAVHGRHPRLRPKGRGRYEPSGT
ncbi:tRNA-dihydrouridine synthase [Thiohalobacter thiocyanaticus]|uniref:DUS-like FMN-binding domain-containing protein n=1 Tax=Thiohalobacter thiocyanaticus TaxID=585455 RepID=A0A426QI39_9GAMM|nr:tRNA-dihydrouridine synthase [Thiohalobacter thiocyanaticus]RRQ21422.1 hypothetical protein D6C00_05345 [Thiohalobacter thiocyanaticus]